MKFAIALAILVTGLFPATAGVITGQSRSGSSDPNESGGTTSTLGEREGDAATNDGDDGDDDDGAGGQLSMSDTKKLLEWFEAKYNKKRDECRQLQEDLANEDVNVNEDEDESDGRLAVAFDELKDTISNFEETAELFFQQLELAGVLLERVGAEKAAHDESIKSLREKYTPLIKRAKEEIGIKHEEWGLSLTDHVAKVEGLIAEMKKLAEIAKTDRQKFGEGDDGLLVAKPEFVKEIQENVDETAFALNELDFHTRTLLRLVPDADAETRERLEQLQQQLCDTRDTYLGEIHERVEGIKDGIAVDKFTTVDEKNDWKSYPEEYAAILKLYRMVNSPLSDPFLGWSDDGKEVVVQPCEKKSIMEKCGLFGFKGLFEEAFMKPLKLSGFDISVREWRQGNQRWVEGRVSHPSFHRGNAWDVRKMRMQMAKREMKKYGREVEELGQCMDPNCNEPRLASRTYGGKAKRRVEYTRCPRHAADDDAVKKSLYSQRLIDQAKREMKEAESRSKDQLKKVADERAKRVNMHMSGADILENTDFRSHWETHGDTIGQYPLEEWDELSQCKKHTGYSVHQLLTPKDLKLIGTGHKRQIGRLLFHRMFLVMGKCCKICLDPVAGTGKDGKVDESFRDTKAFYKWHGDHQSMPMSHEDYIKPSDLPGRMMPFGKRQVNYRDVCLTCNHCHEQGERRVNWVVDQSYTNKVLYDQCEQSIETVLDGDKWKAWKQVVKDYELRSGVISPRVRSEELEAIVWNTLGYKLSDLVTWGTDPKNWEKKGYREQGRFMIGGLSLNFIKKETGRCLGKKGVKCRNQDIRNEVPQRMCGFHGDHDGGKKGCDPASLVTKDLEVMEKELRNLKGRFRCGGCHRGE
ncbi:hypothetical protein ACHAXT_010778 [Thalassiosira profunda]